MWLTCVGSVLVGGVNRVLACVTCYCCCCYYYYYYYYYYYFYCYDWNTILKKRMLNVYFGNKNGKLFQKDLNSAIKETELKNRCWFTLFELHHRCLTELQTFPRFWICQGSKYTKVTQASEKPLHYRYLAEFWMCLQFWYTRVTESSV